MSKKSKKHKLFIFFGLVFGVLALTATVTLTQESWFPSEWGADDRPGCCQPTNTRESAGSSKSD